MRVGALFAICILLCIADIVYSASCTSDEYCPLGWSVKRKTDGSILSCVPHDQSNKCPKPYMCVVSKCGINFCCGNDKMLKRYAEIEEEQREAAAASDEEDL